MQPDICPKTKHETKKIPLTAIHLNPALVIRRYYDEASLKELDGSVFQQGQIYPVIVRPMEGTPDKFELIAGTRRFRVAERQRLKEIEVKIVSGVNDQRALVIALGENLQRQDLTPFEEAWVILKLTKEYKMGISEVAAAINKSESFVRRRLQLLSLPQEIQKLIADRMLSLAQVETLMSVKSHAERLTLARTIQKHNLSDSEFLILVQGRMQKKGQPTRIRKQSKQLSGTRFMLQIKQFSMRLEDAVASLSGLMPAQVREIEFALKELEGKITGAYASIRRIG